MLLCSASVRWRLRELCTDSNYTTPCTFYQESIVDKHVGVSTPPRGMHCRSLYLSYDNDGKP